METFQKMYFDVATVDAVTACVVLEHVGEPRQFVETGGRNALSALVLNASRIDRALTWLPEKLFDALGYGFIMTFVLEKPRGDRG